MKAFSQILNESEDHLANVVISLRSDLQTVLGIGFTVKVGISKMGPRPSINVTIYGAAPAYNIPQNSPVWMNLWMFNADSSSGPVSWESDTIPRALKFRKITNTSILNANSKLVDWFKKVKTQMIDMEEAGRNK